MIEPSTVDRSSATGTGPVRCNKRLCIQAQFDAIASAIKVGVDRKAWKLKCTIVV
jgi:hypothetical protein